MFSAKQNRVSHKILKDEKVTAAFDFFERDAARITAQQIEICRIPAPPFGEAARADFLRRKFVEFGYKNARLDREGNCLALYEGADQHPLLVVSAHLDTVFPIDTVLEPKFDGGKIYLPGIMDDGCGLAALMALAETFKKQQFKIGGSILFVGTVGEEAAGNLRGVRHLLTNGEFAPLVSAFISLDGAGVAQIVNGGVGSKRYAAKLISGGGHSWLDYGAPNPVHALGRAVSKLLTFSVSTEFKTTFNVGKISGGTSVNAIPTEATMEVDLRSENQAELARLDAFFRQSIFAAVDEENDGSRKNSVPLELDLEMTGERLGGATAEAAALVQLALEATRAVNTEPQLTVSSTDANFPMSISIPAITIGAGGAGAQIHTLDEWYDATNRETGLQRALLLVLSYVGLE